MMDVTVLYWVSGGLLVLAVLLSMIRLALGPTMLDRAVAADMITSVGIGLTALVIVWWNREDLLVLMVLFALTGFFSSVTLARFVGRENALERRIISREEAEARQKADDEREERSQSLEAAGISVDQPEDAEEDKR